MRPTGGPPKAKSFIRSHRVYATIAATTRVENQNQNNFQAGISNVSQVNFAWMDSKRLDMKLTILIRSKRKTRQFSVSWSNSCWLLCLVFAKFSIQFKNEPIGRKFINFIQIIDGCEKFLKIKISTLIH